MNITGTCKTCGRELLARQVVEGGGSCPWCGTPFCPDYAVTLVQRLADAEDAGERLEKAIEELADLRPGLSVDVESVIGKIKRDLARIDAPLIRQP